jgi:hypothetical protein
MFSAKHTGGHPRLLVDQRVAMVLNWVLGIYGVDYQVTFWHILATIVVIRFIK